MGSVGMTTLLNIQLDCPVCGVRFGSRAVRSVTRVGQDTDFRPRVAGDDPLPHYVHACPQCRFAAFEGDFDEVEPAVREFVLSGGVDEVEGDDQPPGALAGSTKYLLAALCYEHDSRATLMRMADLYLRASWCARLEGRREREQESQMAAILRFEAALAAGEVPLEQEQTILYLLGELYRRVGRYELAEAMLKKAADFDPEQGDPQITMLAEQQREAAVSGRSENMVIGV